jgi:hypothetical protein
MTQFLAANWIWVLLIGGMLVMRLSHRRRMGGMGQMGGTGGGCGGGQVPSSGGQAHLASPGAPGDWRSDLEHANPSAVGYANPSASGYAEPSPSDQQPQAAGSAHRHGGC